MLLSQYRRENGSSQIVARDGAEADEMATDRTLFDVARDRADDGIALVRRCLDIGLCNAVDRCRAGRLLPPLLHPDPNRLHLAGTGLTHLDAASTRAAIHAEAGAQDSGSRRMLRMNVKRVRLASGQVGVQPE